MFSFTQIKIIKVTYFILNYSNAYKHLLQRKVPIILIKR